MSNAQFHFSNVVVVDGDNVGVIVKTWSNPTGYSYDVYVRYTSRVECYAEKDIKHFVYGKELHDGERDYYA